MAYGGNCSQKVGSITSIRMNESKVFKVTSRFRSWSIVDHPSFRDHSYLVEEVVNTVTRLI